MKTLLKILLTLVRSSIQMRLWPRNQENLRKMEKLGKVTKTKDVSSQTKAKIIPTLIFLFTMYRCEKLDSEEINRKKMDSFEKWFGDVHHPKSSLLPLLFIPALSCSASSHPSFSLVVTMCCLAL